MLRRYQASFLGINVVVEKPTGCVHYGWQLLGIYSPVLVISKVLNRNKITWSWSYASYVTNSSSLIKSYADKYSELCTFFLNGIFSLAYHFLLEHSYRNTLFQNKWQKSSGNRKTQFHGENNSCPSLETLLAGFLTPLSFCVWLKWTTFFSFHILQLLYYKLLCIQVSIDFAKHLIFSFPSIQFSILKFISYIVHLVLSDILALVVRCFASGFII